MLRILLFILLCCFCGRASAQTNLHSGSKRAIKAYQSAKGSLRARDFNEAERLLVKALRVDKGFDEAVLLLHQLYLRKKQPKKSADIFNTSADLKGYGETKPLVALINPEANALNRRVEFKITGFLD